MLTYTTFNFANILFCFILGYLIFQFALFLNKGADPNGSHNYSQIIATEQEKDSTPVKADCNNTLRYCSNDFDCAYFCAQPLLNNIKNVCDPVLKICKPTAILPTNECDQKKGFLDSYVVTEIDGFWKCLNTKPYYFKEDQSMYDYICHNGDLNRYDYSKNIPLYCECQTGYKRVVNINKPNIPLCIKKDKLKLLFNFVEQPQT